MRKEYFSTPVQRQATLHVHTTCNSHYLLALTNAHVRVGATYTHTVYSRTFQTMLFRRVTPVTLPLYSPLHSTNILLNLLYDTLKRYDKRFYESMLMTNK